jgi:hypoxanthine phosphoribosyltransferase
MPGRALQTPLFTANQIRTRIRAMARDIERDYPPQEPLHLVAVLKGAFMFLSDLSRVMTRPVTLDFMAISSYASGTRSSGEVRVIKDVDMSLHGRNVLIIEDIVDTGLTLAYLRDILRARSPKSLRAACLLSKPSRRLVDVVVDYIGFEIEDRFVVGYGLDHGEQFRNLPYIAVFE